MVWNGHSVPDPRDWEWHANVVVIVGIANIIAFLLISYSRGHWHEGELKRMLLIGTGLMLAGVMFWIVEPRLPQCRPGSEEPMVFSLHPLWHICVALGLNMWTCVCKFHRGVFYGFEVEVRGHVLFPRVIWTPRVDDAHGGTRRRLAQHRTRSGRPPAAAAAAEGGDALVSSAVAPHSFGDDTRGGHGGGRSSMRSLIARRHVSRGGTKRISLGERSQEARRRAAALPSLSSGARVLPPKAPPAVAPLAAAPSADPRGNRKAECPLADRVISFRSDGESSPNQANEANEHANELMMAEDADEDMLEAELADAPAPRRLSGGGATATD